MEPTFEISCPIGPVAYGSRSGSVHGARPDGGSGEHLYARASSYGAASTHATAGPGGTGTGYAAVDVDAEDRDSRGYQYPQTVYATPASPSGSAVPGGGGVAKGGARSTRRTCTETGCSH